MPEPDDDKLISARAALTELRRADLAHVDVEQALAKVATLARRVIPGASEVSVTLITNEVPAPRPPPARWPSRWTSCSTEPSTVRA